MPAASAVLPHSMSGSIGQADHSVLQRAPHLPSRSWEEALRPSPSFCRDSQVEGSLRGCRAVRNPHPPWSPPEPGNQVSESWLSLSPFGWESDTSLSWGGGFSSCLLDKDLAFCLFACSPCPGSCPKWYEHIQGSPGTLRIQPLPGPLPYLVAKSEL